MDLIPLHIFYLIVCSPMVTDDHVTWKETETLFFFKIEKICVNKIQKNSFIFMCSNHENLRSR